MVIQLPKDIEERLNELANREGMPAEQLAVDAINEMLQRRGKPDRWPPPTVVGIVDDAQLDTEERGAPRVVHSTKPWARMIGMLSDGGVPVTEFDDWLAAERASDERLARKTSLRR